MKTKFVLTGYSGNLSAYAESILDEIVDEVNDEIESGYSTFDYFGEVEDRVLDLFYEKVEDALMYYSDAIEYMSDNSIFDFDDAIDEGNTSLCSIMSYYLLEELKSARLDYDEVGVKDSVEDLDAEEIFDIIKATKGSILLGEYKKFFDYIEGEELRDFICFDILSKLEKTQRVYSIEDVTIEKIENVLKGDVIEDNEEDEDLIIDLLED